MVSEGTETIKAYDAIAPLYEEYSKKKQAYLDAVDEFVISKLNSTNRLLDVGCGDGRRLSKIKNRVGITDIVAVEPSAKMAEICRANTGVSVYEVFAEDIDKLDIGTFDVVTALWNVFGHIPNSVNRLKALKNIKNKLTRGGVFIMDVNNRHNAVAYGGVKVFWRTLLDGIWFDESRGDAYYDWKIGDKTFKSSGHLFTPSEVENLFSLAGFRILNRFTFNYSTGEISSSKFKGQLFYILAADQRQ